MGLTEADAEPEKAPETVICAEGAALLLIPSLGLAVREPTAALLVPCTEEDGVPEELRLANRDTVATAEVLQQPEAEKEEEAEAHRVWTALCLAEKEADALDEA